MVPHLLFRLVRPQDPTFGRVVTVVTKQLIEVQIPSTAGVSPAVLVPLQEAAIASLPDVLQTLRPGHIPIVRYHVHSPLPGGLLVAVDVEPWQVDIHVATGMMPWSTGDELAAHSTRILQAMASRQLHVQLI